MLHNDKDKRNKKIYIDQVFLVPGAIDLFHTNISSNINYQITKEEIINKAFKFHSQGNISEAAKYYQYFIKEGFQDERVFSNYGLILKNDGKLKEAELSMKKAIKLNPNYAIAQSNLGIILRDLGKLKEAELSIQKAIKLNPNYAEAHSHLGNVFRDLGKLKEAKLSQRKAIKLNPYFAEAHNNLGNIFRDLGKSKESELSYRKAIEIKPDFLEAHFNLGIILKDLSKLQEAELSYRKAIDIKPDFLEAHSNLGSILRDLGRLKEAELSTRKAIQLKPDFTKAYSNLGGILKDLGKYKEAHSCFQKCLELDPYDLAYNMQSKLFISRVPLNKSQIERERKEIDRQISLIGNNSNIIYKNNNLPNSIDFIFYLAYHNCKNDKEILKNIAHNLSKKKGIIDADFNVDHRIKESQSRKKIRLGIYSSFLYNHSITKSYLNLIEDLAESGIEIIVFRGEGDKVDKVTEHIISLANETITLPESLEQSFQLILKTSLDILFYLDIGMSMKTYLMSLSRLALVQVVGCGHLNTTGSPNIDYFISSKYLESKKSDKYYSERLIRLKRIPTNVSIPKLTKEIIFKRSDLNLSDNDFLIGLPHYIFKFHPEFDIVLEKILEEIPKAFLLLFSGNNNEIELLKSRWRGNSKLLLKKSIITPRVDIDKYYSMMKTFDIILDPFFFGMGTTFHQSMAFGIPVVTMLTDQLRGRVAYAGYKQMEIIDPPVAKTPEEYIAICKKLAFDNSYKANIINQINLKSKEQLFNDRTIYKQYKEFFQKALEAAYKKELLTKNWEPVQ